MAVGSFGKQVAWASCPCFIYAEKMHGRDAHATSYNTPAQQKTDEPRKPLRDEGKKEPLFRLSLRRAIASSISC